MSPWVSETTVRRPARDVLIKHLLNLCRIYSPTGYELGTIEYCKTVLGSAGFSVEIGPEGNVYARRGVTTSGKYILINAHTDTVQRDKDVTIIRHPELIQFDPFWNIIWGRGYMVAGDDRCGIAIALALAEATQIPMKVLFTVGEESGCEGVKAVPSSFYQDVVFCFTLDRRGCCDIIGTYGGRKMCPKGLIDLIIKIAKESNVAMKESNGTFADTFHISAHVPSVNLSCGYYNAHSSYDFIRVNETYDMMMVVRECIAKQADFEEEWARTPAEWRPKGYEYVKSYAPVGTTYSEYYGSGLGWGAGLDDRQTDLNYSIAKYDKIFDTKTRQWIQAGIKTAIDLIRIPKKKKTEEKKEEKTKKPKGPKSPQELADKDDIEPVPKDPFGNSYGDLIWAERYNPAWEALTAYPRVKIEKKWEQKWQVQGDGTYPRGSISKEPEFPPSEPLLETEAIRLKEIVELMATETVTSDYTWIFGRTKYTVRFRIPADMSAIVIGWVQYKTEDGGVIYRPVLKDATSVYEFAKILDDYPNTDIAYKIANLSVDVATRIEDVVDPAKKYWERSFPMDQFNAFVDALAIIDNKSLPFKTRKVTGGIFEAAVLKQTGINGWNSAGRATVYIVEPTSPSFDGWTNGTRTLKETVIIYGTLKSLRYIRNIFYGKDAKLDAALDKIEKESIEWFSKQGQITPLPVANREYAAPGISQMFIDEMFPYLDMSYNASTRGTGIPWRLMDQVSTEELDREQLKVFSDILSKLGEVTAVTTYGGTFKFEAYDLGNLIEAGTIDINTPVGRKIETVEGRSDVFTYNNSVKDVLTLYNNIGILLNDYIVKSSDEERLEFALRDLEYLIEDIFYAALDEEATFEGKVTPGEESLTSSSELAEVGCDVATYPKGGPERDYEFVMPFFHPEPCEIEEALTPKEFSSFAKQYPKIKLTTEEISCLSAGIANYAYMMANIYRAWTATGGDPVEVVTHNITPDAEYIASFSVVDPDSKNILWEWHVVPNLKGLATMYFVSKRLKYNNNKVNLVVRYFSTIAYYVVLRVTEGIAIRYDNDLKKFGLVETGKPMKLKRAKKKDKKKSKKSKKEETDAWVSLLMTTKELTLPPKIAKAKEFIEQSVLRGVASDYRTKYGLSNIAARVTINEITDLTKKLIYEVFTDFVKIEFHVYKIGGKVEFYGTVWKKIDSGKDQWQSGVSGRSIYELDGWIRDSLGLEKSAKVHRVKSKSEDHHPPKKKREKKRKKKEEEFVPYSQRRRETEEYNYDREAYKHRRGSSSEYDRDSSPDYSPP